MIEVENREHITVAIPTLGRFDTLAAVISSIAFQTYPVDQFVLLDESGIAVTTSATIQHTMDVLSVQGTEVVVYRNRNRKGIGYARYDLAKKCKNNTIIMLDDDVLLRPDCIEQLVKKTPEKYPWSVPTCFLVPAALTTNESIDGYIDSIIDPDDVRVRSFIERYPWYIPYFRYSRDFSGELSVSGTQCILLKKDAFLSKCRGITRLGKLPREDTYMTIKMGMGYFVSTAECLHIPHKDQVDRGNWAKSMFYRIHDAIIDKPDMFIDFLGWEDE